MMKDLDSASRRLLQALENVISYTANDPWAASINEECKSAVTEFVGALTNLKKLNGKYVQVPILPTTDMLYAMAECDGYLRGDPDHPMLTQWEDYWHAALMNIPEPTVP